MKDPFLYGANVHANGIRQHYLRYGGAGHPLVLIPGITSPAITWGFVAERLAAQFDVHVLDVRGRGLSETGPSLAYDLDTYAADVAGFASELGLEDYVLMGHSMGARIGIRLARHHGRVGKLVLIDPPVSGPGRRAYPAALPWYLESIRQSKEGMTADAMRAFCPTWTEAQLRLRAEWLHTCDEDAVRRTFTGFHEEDIHGDLPFMTQPALLVVATRGGVIESVDEAEMRELAPALDIVHVPDAGHMIPWDNLDGFLDLITPFLRS